MLLNYIWAGLIIIALVFALVADTIDLVQDTYRNNEALPIELVFPEGFDPEARRQPVQVRIDSTTFQQFYRTDATPDTVYSAELSLIEGAYQLRLPAEARLPEPLATIRDRVNPRDRQLQGVIVGRQAEDAAAAPWPPPLAPDPPAAEDPAAPAEEVFAVGLQFEPIYFVNMNNIAQAALDFASTAAQIAIGLIGILALFLGLLKIGEEAGVIRAMTRFVRPVLKPLFPDVPDDHPALSVIALNMAANMFGLGNAATPFGIKAMEELQRLNPSQDTATNPMVMLLAINTASVQIVPPVLLMALMGLLINQLIFAILITTGISLIVAIVAAKTLGRLPGYRASDPQRTHGAAGPPPPPDDEPLR